MDSSASLCSPKLDYHIRTATIPITSSYALDYRLHYEHFSTILRQLRLSSHASRYRSALPKLGSFRSSAWPHGLVSHQMLGPIHYTVLKVSLKMSNI